MIKLENLTKNYHTQYGQYTALVNINLSIHKGEIFGVMGRSGAGKSTLIRCVNLLEHPSSGKVLVNDMDLLALDSASLRSARHKIGMIFQHFNLLNSRNVYDNIALPLELVGLPQHEIKKRVLDLLDLTGLAERQNHYPAQLSGGQKQRVAIARALANQPQVLLSDEATSALDPETTQSILALLKKINRELNLTIMLITHEMDVIKRCCDRAAILDHGKLIEVASVVDLFTRPQSDIAKSFTQSAMHIHLPEVLAHKLQSSPSANTVPIIKLTFLGEKAEEPIVVSLMSKFNVMTNILQANLEMVGEASVGMTLCELLGSHDAIEQSIAFIKSQNIQVEVLGYVANK